MILQRKIPIYIRLDWIIFLQLLLINSCLAAGLNYTWLRKDSRWDFVVGIAIKGKPQAVGVLIRPNIVLTSANAVYRLKGKKLRSIEIYVINGEWDRSQIYYANCAHCVPNCIGYKHNNTEFWLEIGPKNVSIPFLRSEHVTTLHDLYTLSFETEKKMPVALPVTKRSKTKGRQPIIPKLAYNYSVAGARNWAIAGFGFIDKTHVVKGTQLDTEEFTDEVIVNCDEYLPRQWGRFICIRNYFKNAGVQLGSPLMYKGVLFGIGCFSLQKGKDDILVFTDIRPYLVNLTFCEETKRGTHKWWYLHEEVSHITSDLPWI